MKEIPDSVAKFMSEQVVKYARAGYRIVVHPEEKIVSGSMVYTGEATPEKLEIAIGGDWRGWIGILVHETCHLDQHIEFKESFCLAENSLASVTSWLEGKGSAQPPAEHFFRVVENESDCECRAVEKIKACNLPVDIADYVRRANVYLGSYAVSQRHRVWIPQPYRSEDLCRSTLSTRVLTAEEIFSSPEKMPPDSEFLKLVASPPRPS